MRPSGGSIMRVSTYLMTVDPLDAGGMLELETVRKALKIAGNVFGLHVRGRGPRKEAAIKDGKGPRGYDMYLPLRHATRYDVYLRRR